MDHNSSNGSPAAASSASASGLGEAAPSPLVGADASELDLIIDGRPWQDYSANELLALILVQQIEINQAFQNIAKAMESFSSSSMLKMFGGGARG